MEDEAGSVRDGVYYTYECVEMGSNGFAQIVAGEPNIEFVWTHGDILIGANLYVQEESK